MFSKQIRKKILFPLLCFLGITVSMSCTPKPSRFGIVFTNNFADIYRIVDNTKSKIEQLTYTPTIGEYPFLVSQNGDKIIFEVGLTGSTEEQQQNVYILDTSSKEITNITNVFTKFAMVSHDFSADWSPDEKQFVMVDYGRLDDEVESFLEIIDVSGKDRKEIPIPTHRDIPSLIQTADWSPDGKKFVLTRGVIGLEQKLQNPGSAILVYYLEGGNLVQVTDYSDGCIPRGWSPNNKQIVAVCSPNFPYMSESAASLPSTVRIFDIENLGQAYEHIAFTSCDDPSWSPDGKQIAFVCAKGKNYRGLFVANAYSNGIHEIKLENLGNPAILNTPIWSPDGTQIIYVAGSDYEHTNIYSIYLDDLSNHVLTNQDGLYHLVSVYSLP